ncbi:hypothetical protein AAFN85_30785 [Mucilaginibacter sp. CAU 1740]|uniref:hypothetical protein n=1 Tax=Mucilaginibacter sp. CAU 1740 TaxID=3140365 RepID=UPI00325A6E64
MKTILTAAQQKLADFMSYLSEEAYAAGWMSGLEYELWEMVLNGPRKYGRHFINQDDIDTLIQLSNEFSAWIYFDNETEETAIPITEWEKMYGGYLARNPGLARS